MAAPADPPTARRSARRVASEPTVVTVIFAGRLAHADVAALCDVVRTALESGDADVVLCDVSGLVGPDITTLGVLARVQLIACRLGCRVRLRHASCELRGLLALTGLEEALPSCDDPAASPPRGRAPRDDLGGRGRS